MPGLPEEVSKVSDCYINNYVHGRVRTLGISARVVLCKQMHTYDWIPHTKHNEQAWHRSWDNLIGNSHISVHTTLFQKEQYYVQNKCEYVLSQDPCPQKKKNPSSSLWCKTSKVIYNHES